MRVDVSLLGWSCSLLLFIFLVILIIEKIKLNRTLVCLKKQHHDYVVKQMVDLRKICHNINTPLNSIITVFEIFKMKLYGDLPEQYSLYADNAHEAISDLKHNLQDIQSYCNRYSDIHAISISDLQKKSDIHIENPYVLEV
jgi:hypothetical protein